MTRRALAAVLATAVWGCGGPPQPVTLDARNDTCAWCRMGVSDPRLAAQLVAALEEPKLFDDVGCLRDYLASGAPLPPDAVAYVADHRTRAWVLAASAVYAQDPALSTPMGSGIAAWSDSSSRAADTAIPRGTSRSPREIFGRAGPPRGER